MTAATHETRNPRLVTLPSLPGLGGLYAKGVASSGRIAVTRSPVGRALPGTRDVVLPSVVYRVTDVPTSGVTEPSSSAYGASTVPPVRVRTVPSASIRTGVSPMPPGVGCEV